MKFPKVTVDGHTFDTYEEALRSVGTLLGLDDFEDERMKQLCFHLINGYISVVTAPSKLDTFLSALQTEESKFILGQALSVADFLLLTLYKEHQRTLSHPQLTTYFKLLESTIFAENSPVKEQTFFVKEEVS
jgi:hypothetical protein